MLKIWHASLGVIVVLRAGFNSGRTGELSDQELANHPQ